MKNYLITPLLITFVAMTLVGGCGDDRRSSRTPMPSARDGGSTAVCNPLYNWVLTIRFTAGDCGLTGTREVVFTVTEDPSGGYIITEPDPSLSVSTTITDVGGSCRLSAFERDPDVNGDGTTSATLQYNLTADTTGAITGSGTISLSGGITCGQAFTAIGMLR